MKRIFKISLFLLVVVMSFLSVYTLYAETYDSRKTYSLEVDVNDPDSIEEIMDKIGISAYDHGLDITETIVSVRSNDYINNVLNQPTASKRQLGAYTIVFQAEDARGNVSTMNVIVEVVDNDGPELLEVLSSDIIGISVNEIDKFGTDIVEKRILDKVKGIDNHDLFDVEYSVDYSNVQTKNGSYNAYVTITDQSDNSNTFTIRIDIYDEVKPRFEASTEYLFADTNNEFTPESIIELADIRAYDSHNNLLNVSLREGEDGGPYSTAGIYVITFEANDGNMASYFDFYLEVFEDVDITFDVDETVLVVTNNNVSTNISRIDDLIRLKTHEENYTYEVISDEYSDNYNVDGDYNYDVVVTFEDGREEEMHFVMRVISDVQKSDEESDIEGGSVEIKKTSFFEKAWRIVLKAFIIILGIFKWPFTLL